MADEKKSKRSGRDKSRSTFSFGNGGSNGSSGGGSSSTGSGGGGSSSRFRGASLVPIPNKHKHSVTTVVVREVTHLPTGMMAFGVVEVPPKHDTVRLELPAGMLSRATAFAVHAYATATDNRQARVYSIVDQEHDRVDLVLEDAAPTCYYSLLSNNTPAAATTSPR